MQDMESFPHVDIDQAFFFKDGSLVRNLPELLEKLKTLDETIFKEHVNTERHDIAQWIHNTLQDELLAEQLRATQDLATTITYLETHIKEATIPTTHKQEITIFFKKIQQHKQTLFSLFLSIFAVLILLLLMQQYQAQEQIEELNYRLEKQQEQMQKVDRALADGILILQEELMNKNKDQNITIFKINDQNKSTIIAPLPRIEEDQIKIFADRIELSISNTSWTTFNNSDSMLPVLDEGAYGIQIKPDTTETINKGDIVAYQQDDIIIIHRVISTGVDEQGWYAITKGDNNLSPDPEKVRFDAITGILVGIIY